MPRMRPPQLPGRVRPPCVHLHLARAPISKLPTSLKLTDTDPFAAWFVETGGATRDGIRALMSRGCDSRRISPACACFIIKTLDISDDSTRVPTRSCRSLHHVGIPRHRSLRGIDILRNIARTPAITWAKLLKNGLQNVTFTGRQL